MDYADDVTWPQGADGGGYTLELLSATGNLSDGANWFEGCLGGSPGTAYSSGSVSVIANGDTSFCAGGSVILQANTGGGLTYEWQNGNQIIAGATGSFYSASQGGSYTVVVTSNGCASVSDSIVVTIMPGPGDPVVSTIANCGEGIFTLNAISADSLFWYDAPNGNLLAIGNTYTTPLLNVTTVYYVQAINVCAGSFVADSVIIVNAAADPVVTPGISCGAGAVSLSASSADTLFWYDAIGGNLLWTGPVYQTPQLSSTTTYYVVAGSFCPSDFVPVTATIFSLPVVSLGNDTIVESPAFVIVNAGTGFVSYLWSSTETTQSIVVQNSGDYWVTVTDANGCTATDTINVLVTVGLSEADSHDALHIYPNPVRNLLSLELNSNEPAALQLIDVTGRVVWHSEFTEPSIIHVDVSGYSKGIYLLKMQSDNSFKSYLIVIE
jgi:hypothetical protein